jgi:hypothetical protein
MRAALCDCERPTEPKLPQTLFLMADSTLLEKIENGRLPALLSSGMSDEAAVEELFLGTLSRPPDKAEQRAALEQIRSQYDRRAGFVDILWALVNTREFILNH